MIDATNTAFAVLGVIGQVLIVVFLALIVALILSPSLRRRLVRSWGALQVGALAAAWVVAAIATGGSLYFSEIADFVPCQLCWYQRICMYPLVVTLAVGVWMRGRGAALYSLLFPLVGIAIAARHIYIEENPGAETCVVGVPCSLKWIDEFGYITIPVLAMTAFVLIAILSAVALVAGRYKDRDHADAAQSRSCVGTQQIATRDSPSVSYGAAIHSRSSHSWNSPNASCDSHRSQPADSPVHATGRV